MLHPRITPAGLLLALTMATGCSQATADLEIGLADRAVQDAARNRASDCAPEMQRAAEQALAEARRLAASGDIDDAKSKASQAETLAKQAADASPPGCDQTEEDPGRGDASARGSEASGDTDAARDLEATLESALQTVYFDYNRSVIREDSQVALTALAEHLRRAPNTTIEIEGHCDVRGSTEYNLHLGERRARSVMKYLVTQGVNPNQLQTISFGEERPVDFGSSEDAHAANRRAELRRL